jgi:hypothetical protein
MAMVYIIAPLHPADCTDRQQTINALDMRQQQIKGDCSQELVVEGVDCNG